MTTEIATVGEASTWVAKYDEACRAIAEAKTIEVAFDLRNKVDALRQAARIAKNLDGEMDFAEARFKAERKMGEMLAAQKAEFGFHPGGRPRKTPADAEGVSAPVSLEEAGIDYKLSSRAQKMAELSDDQFKRQLGEWREASRADGKVRVDLLRHGQEQRQRQGRRDLAQSLSEASTQLSPTGKKFPFVYADPALKRKAGIGDRAYENHYPTMTWDEIIAMPVKDRLLPDALVAIWMPRAHLLHLHPVKYAARTPEGDEFEVEVPTPLVWAIARAWGCDAYSTCAVWTKTDDEHPREHGTGLMLYDQDEILCIFRRGKGLPKPSSDEKFGSNHRERSKPLGHSRKPEHFRKMIAAMAGTDSNGVPLPVLELFARVDEDHPLPPNWSAWGNQAGEVEAAPAQLDLVVAAAPDAADDDECTLWWALAAVNAGMTVLGAATIAVSKKVGDQVIHVPVRQLIGDGLAVLDDRTQKLSLTQEGRACLLELDRTYLSQADEQFEDTGTEIPAFLPASTITADGCTPPAGGAAVAAASPARSEPGEDPLDIPAFLRRAPVPA